jgi:hypothetical protein
MTHERFPFKWTKHGFRWGPVLVELFNSHGARGVELSITTPEQYVHINVTPRGFIHIQDVHSTGTYRRQLW